MQLINTIQSSNCDIFDNAIARYERIFASMIENTPGDKYLEGNVRTVFVDSSACEQVLQPTMNERYVIDVTADKVSVWNWVRLEYVDHCLQM